MALTACGGGSTGASAKELYAHELRPNPVVKPVAGIDPDQEPESSADATFVVESLSARNYELDVTNTSDVGFINVFRWSPPVGMTIVHVGKSSTGQCSLSHSQILCRAALPPPRCSCRPGGTMTVRFSAREVHTRKPVLAVRRRVAGQSRVVPEYVATAQRGVVTAYLEIDAMTPVPYKIPSDLGDEAPQEDLPLCERGAPHGHGDGCIHTR